MGVIIDLVTHLPEEIWFWTNPKQADTHWEEDLLKTVKPKTLLYGMRLLSLRFLGKTNRERNWIYYSD